MTEATVSARLEVNDPTSEVVILTATDNQTYISKKFGAIRGVQATLYHDAGSLTIPLSVSVSGGTVTFRCTGLSSKDICVVLYGTK